MTTDAGSGEPAYGGLSGGGPPYPTSSCLRVVARSGASARVGLSIGFVRYFVIGIVAKDSAPDWMLDRGGA